MRRACSHTNRTHVEEVTPGAPDTEKSPNYATLLSYRIEVVSTELRGFCDASEAVYSGVIYSRAIDIKGEVQSLKQRSRP